MSMSLEKIKSTIRDDLDENFFDFSDEENNFNLIRLPSKRNLVFDVQFEKKPTELPQNFILKIFKKRNAQKEFDILRSLKKKNLCIPEIISFKPPLYLLLEKISGETLTDFINNRLKGHVRLSDVQNEKVIEIKEAVNALASWMSEFHRKNLKDSENHSKIIVLNKGDTRLRDFIYNDSQKIVASDFETAYNGNYLDDLAWIACSFLDTNPGIFQMDNPEHKVELINLFLATYHKQNREFYFSFSYFAEKLIEDLNLVIKRRSLDIGKLDKRVVLKSFEELS